jgi:AcrR family transcriptional regulator
MAGTERRALILEKAREVFVSRGLNATTKEIARAAGITEATMFGHFPTKDALFEAAVIAPLNQLMQSQPAIEAEFENANDIEKQRKVFLGGIHKNIDTMKEILPLLSIALFSNPENGDTIFKHTVQPLLDDIEKSMGFIPTGFIDRVNRRAIASALFGIYFGAALQLRFDRQSPDEAVLGVALTEFIWRAMFAAEDTFDRQVTGLRSRPSATP